jgi:copper(I)-binding protein
MSCGRHLRSAAFAGLALWAPPVLAAEPAISLSQAWAPAAARGDDTAVYMVVRNAGAADALVRVRCAIANFTELHTVDRGEGFPSNRAVKSIPIAAESVTTLTPDGYSVALLQTTRALAPNDAFDCVIRFRDGGQQTIDVTVR